ncbi:TPA: hypothetical protein WH312_001789 [Neisseria meningitidis]
MTQYLPFFSLSIIRYAQITATQADTVPIAGKNAANPSSAAQGNGRIRFPRRPTTGTATYPQSKATTGISNAATKKPTTSARFTSPPIPTTILYRFRAMLK